MDEHLLLMAKNFQNIHYEHPSINAKRQVRSGGIDHILIPLA